MAESNTEMKKVEFDPNKVYTLKEAKDLLRQNKNQPLAGLQFQGGRSEEPTTGVVLPDLNKFGKVQAKMKCWAGGSDHVRAMSDWHQCSRSPDMAGKKLPKKDEVKLDIATQ